MATKTFTASATVSLSATGTSTATGSMSWNAPSLPEGATAWDSIRVSGSWSWNGKGNISRVTINGTNTSATVPFDIALSTSQSSPLSITCVGGNKNATGSNFRWSDLVLTFTCTVTGGEQFWVGINGVAVPVKTIWRASNGSLVEIQPDNLDQNAKYVLKP